MFATVFCQLKRVLIMWIGSSVTSFASLEDNGVPEQNALYILLGEI